MNKRQRKKEYKKCRKELIFKKAVAIMQVSIQGALNVVNDIKVNGYTENTENMIRQTKVRAGVIAASPIPSFKRGGIVVKADDKSIIIPNDIDSLIRESTSMSS